MGWLYGERSLEALVRELTLPGESENARRTTLGHALTRDDHGQLVLWQAVKLDAKTDRCAPGVMKAGESCVYIGCDLIDGGGSNWGYKPMDESAHPYYWACPKRLLDLATKPITPRAAEWRTEVLEYHKAHRVRELSLGAIA